MALIVVLEEILPSESTSPHLYGSGVGAPVGRRPQRQLCVTNIHLYWDVQFEDVKLWQTLVLVQVYIAWVCIEVYIAWVCIVSRYM